MMGSVHPFFLFFIFISSPQGREAGAGPTCTDSHVASNVCMCLIALFVSVCVCMPLCRYAVIESHLSTFLLFVAVESIG